jgi:hypothetical protein
MAGTLSLQTFERGLATGPANTILVWERGADAFTSRSGVSTIGDASQLSEMFGRDLGELGVKGENPMRDVRRPHLGHHRKPAASCAAFGEKPSLARRFVSGHLALAPEWVDRPARLPPDAKPPASPPS